MDSGNSSSMQSSSGGDEEYDSRAESVPAFLNTSSHFSPLSNPHPSLVPHHQDHPPTFFDPSANYLNPFSQSQPNSSLLNFDGVRPRSLRSEPNCSDLGNLTGSSTSCQSILGAQGLNQGSFPSSSSVQSRPAHDNGVRSLTQSDQTNVVKNPKKRTRASRRAPTTVLTTDTTNFRAMVQEFTGIPAPPFSGSSYSRRLDLFGSGTGSGIRSSHLEPLGSLYPLRPSAKRIQPTPFVSSSSPSLLNNPLVNAANITNTTSNSTIPISIAPTTNAFNPTSGNYQLPSDLGLLKQPQNMLNLQNQSPVLSFQSFLQPPPLHPSLNLPGFGEKSQGSSAMPSLDELGLSHGHVNANLGGLQSHVSNWRDGVGLNDGNYGSSDHHNSQRVNNCKLNYSASSSVFHQEKGLENVSSRAEGTVDSWICPAE
ncbi:uncharacterized protein LOC111311274 [Durio zibethinus]|uniref:Uncharacterized protein LOC111311274 n=1 Tax=Durio zibethinus TaxID=66656 RepID=A0A6P6ANJ9_DURZI|nr:uncharacterized protein LOC111311274 [Durio zibethinus]